jgi:hypothetical protein
MKHIEKPGAYIFSPLVATPKKDTAYSYEKL